MILPFPIHFKDWKNYPFTLLLIGLNVLIYVMFFTGPDSEPNRDFLESESLKTTGRLYSQYLAQDKSGTPRPSWVSQMRTDNTEHLVTLGVYAIRDAQFLLDGENFSFAGDQVAIKEWKKSFVEFRKSYQDQPLYRFGLSSIGLKSMAWVTYQFSHAGFLHLFSNMIFLFLMGMAVESIIGGVGLLALYLLGGFLGGWVFLWMDSHGSIPMVGASASISALMAFYCLAETRLRIRYYYFVSPVPGQHGEIFLPTLLMIPLFLLSDLGNLWSQPEGLGGGVAYAAHIGGSLLGLVAAILYRIYMSKAVLKKNTSSSSL